MSKITEVEKTCPLIKATKIIGIIAMLLSITTLILIIDKYLI